MVDRPEPKEEKLRKLDRHKIGARTIGGGGGRDTVLTNGLDLQLGIMGRLGKMTAEACLENLR